MMSHKKTALALIWLVGLTSCQPPPVVDLDQDPSGYGEYSVEEEESLPQQTRWRAPGHSGEATVQQGVGPVEYQDLVDRQAFTSIFTALITMAMGFIRPLLSNLAVGTSNAILATMLRKRLALIPEARTSMAAVLRRPKVPSPTVRAL